MARKERSDGVLRIGENLTDSSRKTLIRLKEKISQGYIAKPDIIKEVRSVTITNNPSGVFIGHFKRSDEDFLGDAMGGAEDGGRILHAEV